LPLRARELGVQLVVWDVLARRHSSDENDNPAMRSVMHAVRLASADRAHVVVHHSRKPASGQENVNFGAAGMRGWSQPTSWDSSSFDSGSWDSAIGSSWDD